MLCLIAAVNPACIAAEPSAAPATTTPPAPAVQEENGFSGSWLSAEGNDRFGLTLTQTGTVLTGRHSSSLGGSKQIDAVAINQPPSINGEVKGDSVVVRFRSGALDTQGGYGHALLTLRGRYLYWQKMDESGGNHLPANAILIRQESVQ